MAALSELCAWLSAPGMHMHIYIHMHTDAYILAAAPTHRMYSDALEPNPNPVQPCAPSSCNPNATPNPSLGNTLERLDLRDAMSSPDAADNPAQSEAAVSTRRPIPNP